MRNATFIEWSQIAAYAIIFAALSYYLARYENSYFLPYVGCGVGCVFVLAWLTRCLPKLLIPLWYFVAGGAVLIVSAFTLAWMVNYVASDIAAYRAQPTCIWTTQGHEVCGELSR